MRINVHSLSYDNENVTINFLIGRKEINRKNIKKISIVNGEVIIQMSNDEIITKKFNNKEYSDTNFLNEKLKWRKND